MFANIMIRNALKDLFIFNNVFISNLLFCRYYSKLILTRMALYDTFQFLVFFIVFCIVIRKVSVYKKYKNVLQKQFLQFGIFHVRCTCVHAHMCMCVRDIYVLKIHLLNYNTYYLFVNYELKLANHVILQQHYIFHSI